MDSAERACASQSGPAGHLQELVQAGGGAFGWELSQLFLAIILYLSGNNYRPVQLLGDRQVLEFQTYGLHNSGATADFVRDILRLRIICTVILLVTFDYL